MGLPLHTQEGHPAESLGLPAGTAPGPSPNRVDREAAGMAPACSYAVLLPSGTTCSHLKAQMRPRGIWHRTSTAGSTPLPHKAVLQGPAV